MAKPKKRPVVRTELADAIDVFKRHTDRAAALIAAAYVDDALEGYLRAAFRDDRKAVDALLGSLLGSFSARISVAFLTGLIGAPLREDLDRIRKIRNDFAHVRDNITFKSQSIQEPSRNFHALKAWKLGGGGTFRSARHRYIATAMLATNYITAISEDPMYALFRNVDDYGTAIRHATKSMSLADAIQAAKAATER